MTNLLGAIPSWALYVAMGVILVLFVGMSFMSNKKRKKQMEAMSNNMEVGAKVMTIGRLVGYIVSIDAERNQIVLNVGTENNPTYITVDKQAVGMVMQKASDVKASAAFTGNDPTDTSFGASITEENVFDNDASSEETTEAAPEEKDTDDTKF